MWALAMWHPLVWLTALSPLIRDIYVRNTGNGLNVHDQVKHVELKSIHIRTTLESECDNMSK